MKGKFDYNEFDNELKKKKKHKKKHKKTSDSKNLTYRKPVETATCPKVVINLNIGTDLTRNMLAILVSKLNDTNNNNN